MGNLADKLVLVHSDSLGDYVCKKSFLFLFFLFVFFFLTNQKQEGYYRIKKKTDWLQHVNLI